jgi:hypothetical protein
MGNGKKDDLSGVAKKCDKSLGCLVVEVMIYKALDPKSKRQAKSGLTIQISGPTDVADQTTNAKGRTPVVSSLQPGNYTATVKFSNADQDLYDVTAAALSQNVPKGKTTVFPIEVPWFWIDYQVTYPDGKTLVPGIDYVLRYKKPLPADAPWTRRSNATTASRKASEEHVPAGRYKVDLKLVYDPVWGDDHMEIDKPIDLKATVSGFDPGQAGTIEILDAHALTPALQTINVTVTRTADQADREVKTTWTPTKAQLKDLKSGKISFRANVAHSSTLSAPLGVFTKDIYDVVDDDGNNLPNTWVRLRFSGGHDGSTHAINGKLDVLVPWNEVIARIDMTDYSGKRVDLDEGGIVGRSFQMP